jgi:outer membrane immunogenic protein
MKRLLFVACALCGGLSSAAAADLASSMPTKAAPLQGVHYNWAGFYVGANVGGAFASQVSTNTANTTAFGDMVPGNTISDHLSGIIAGGQIGVNFVNGRLLYGVEVLFDAADVHNGTASTFGVMDDRFKPTISSLALVTARVGYTWDNVLLFAKGGYAGANLKLTVTDQAPPSVGQGSDTRWASGWTVGAGAEIGLDGNWSLGAEYDFASLKADGFQLAGGAPGAYTFSAREKAVHLVMVHLNYRFVW